MVIVLIVERFADRFKCIFYGQLRITFHEERQRLEFRIIQSPTRIDQMRLCTRLTDIYDARAIEILHSMDHRDKYFAIWGGIIYLKVSFHIDKGNKKIR